MNPNKKELLLYISFCEAVHSDLTKSEIEYVLDLFGCDVEVVGSQLDEDGITLVLEGPENQVMAVIDRIEDKP